MATTNEAAASIAAQDTFTGICTGQNGVVTMVVSGTFVATVVMQIRAPRDTDGSLWADDNTGWSDVTDASLTAAGQKTTVPLGGSWHVRAGIKTAGYTSGTAKVWIKAHVG